MSARTKKSPEKSPLPVEGWPRPYMRDGVPGLPIERQEEMLVAAGLSVAEGSVWVDHLSRAKIRARAPLPERDSAVDPRHEGEVVYVASLRVLGWDNLDVMRAMQIAARKDVRVHCLDVGETYSGDMPASELLSALVRSEMARRRARTHRATEAQVSSRTARVEAGIEIAKGLWDGPLPVVLIAKLAKVSTRTLYARLPPRRDWRERQKGKPHA